MDGLPKSESTDRVFSHDTPRQRLLELSVGEAKAAGLMSGKSGHVSFRAPSALVEAARRRTGIQSMTELGIAALASLALPDPVAEFMRAHDGALAGIDPIEP